MTMIGKEAFEVDLIRAFLGFFKSYGFDKTLGLLVLYLALIESVMNAAKVDEVERTSSEDKHCFEIKSVINGSEIVEDTALVGELELANTRELVIDGSRIREQIGVVFYVTAQADLLLRKL